MRLCILRVYLLQLFESTSRAITNVSRKRTSTTPGADNDEHEEEEDNSELFTVCGQLAAEEKLLEPVNTALLLWETSFSPKKCAKLDDKLDLSVTVDYIEVVVLIYKLMQVSK